VPRGSPPSWSEMLHTTVGLTGRILISISLPRSTWPSDFVRGREEERTDPIEQAGCATPVLA
jgi:hypothetical protein